ncbi:MAG TPA: thrombospondin type 3 repeat-containing protein, partial [Polyangiaceae bacterium]
FTDPTLGGMTTRPVESLLGLDLIAGLGLGSRVGVGLSLPTALYQSGTSPVPRSIVASGNVASPTIGDLGIHGKVAILDNAQGGFGLAALGTVTVPTGDPSSFMGEGSATVGANLLAEYTLLVASLQASVGYRLRIDQRTFPDASVGGMTYGDVVPWTAGVTLKPDVFKLDPGHRQRWDVAFHGWFPATPVGPGTPGSARELPALATLSDRIELGHYHDSYVLAGVDLGINDRAMGVPIIRGIVGIGWAPRNHDIDNDGVPDDLDQCPELPEDRDGFEDSDGCPEIDNDDDGVLDKDDACPTVAGSPSSDPKQNGCPQPDRDGDGVPDGSDACPDQKGIETDDPKTNGCPVSTDRDHDGIPDRADRCPDQPEDKDAVEDEDGCPDPDNDGDGIADVQDACPREAGQPSSDPRYNGCPNPDRDGDTFENASDKCPDEPETFNGVTDDDGCPDTGGKPIAVLEGETAKAGAKLHPRIKLRPDAKLVAGSTALRAIVVELHRHPEWTVLVAARADRNAKAEAPLAQASLLADELDALAHRNLAEPSAWDPLAKEPATTADVKIVILTTPAVPAEAPLPAAPKP